LRREYPKRPFVAVAIIAINRGNILLEKRRNDPNRERWTVPGGLIELGESTDQAAVREMMEETGLVVAKLRLFDVFDSIIRDDTGKVKYHFVNIYYSVRIRGRKLNAGSDAIDLRWVSFADLNHYDLTDKFRVFLCKNKKRLRWLAS